MHILYLCMLNVKKYRGEADVHLRRFTALNVSFVRGEAIKRYNKQPNHILPIVAFDIVFLNFPNPKTKKNECIDLFEWYGVVRNKHTGSSYYVKITDNCAYLFFFSDDCKARWAGRKIRGFYRRYPTLDEIWINRDKMNYIEFIETNKITK